MLDSFVDHKGALDHFSFNGLGFLGAFFGRSFEFFGLGHLGQFLKSFKLRELLFKVASIC